VYVQTRKRHRGTYEHLFAGLYMHLCRTACHVSADMRTCMRRACPDMHAIEPSTFAVRLTRMSHRGRMLQASLNLMSRSTAWFFAFLQCLRCSSCVSNRRPVSNPTPSKRRSLAASILRKAHRPCVCFPAFESRTLISALWLSPDVHIHRSGNFSDSLIRLERCFPRMSTVHCGTAHNTTKQQQVSTAQRWHRYATQHNKRCPCSRHRIYLTLAASYERL
jgi:hypothetical protein